jgi:NADH-quinone oxidoreductase subunit M
VSWIERFSIDYFLGVDGISLPLVLLTTVIMFLAVLASWNIEQNVRAYLALLLFLETGVLGAFIALDFFLFYVFYEVMLVPMYFLVALWGGPKKEVAALKFFLYTLVGSVFILIGLLACYFTDVRDFVDPQLAAARLEQTRQLNPTLSAEQVQAAATVHTFDLLVLHKAGRAALQVLSGTPIDKIEAPGKATPGFAERLKQPFFSASFQMTVFLLLFVGFAVKLPIVPLHSWLPDAHVEAPTPVSMILAGILLKLGGYGLIRLAWPICPWAAHELAWTLALVGVINIVYGAFVALGQSDFKRLLAYSSVSHMGYVLLGLAVWAGGNRAQHWAWGMNGAMFQMVAHGISSAALFFVVGVIYERAHHRDLNRFRGLLEPMPLYGGLSAIAFFALMGLPGLCGFWGELFVMIAAWNFAPGLAIAAIGTTVLTAAYLLWTYQRVYLGTNPETAHYPELTLREGLCLAPLAVLAILLGVLPWLLTSWMEPSVTGLVQSLARLQP